ncbi:MAG: 2,3-bisphosphoglycerate-independent phosphoglycerate mutase [Myxococcales bacterium]|nr:2,3-bisphosphoglycerate-independent phosphoglycerate mutase [Myxococcales bacterium]
MSEWTLRPGRFDAVTGPVLLVVLDGVGLGPADEGNALHLAHTPTLDDLFGRFGVLPIAAHGTAVGLPSDDDMGNSEVGHNAIGAGRVFDQGAKRVNAAIQSGEMFDGDTWRWLVDGVRRSGEPLHFIGLLSDGNVHSHEKHLHAMLRRAVKDGVEAARVHILLDGRDVGERSAEIYIDRLESVLAELGDVDYRIASGGGRMHITMDRYEADWEMVARGWAIHVHGEGRRFKTAAEALATLRDETGATDQFLPGFVIADADGPIGPIRDGASVILTNFRGDRAIELSRAFDDDTLDAIDRGRRPDVRFAGMMEYDGDLHIPRRYLVDPPHIDRTMGEYLAKNGVTQFACSETQKFGHVTYFWNGNKSGAFDDALEVYTRVPSDAVPFEERPWMKAAEIVDATLAALQTGQIQHARINFANGDMVGHTGARDAAITAMSCVDVALRRLLNGLAEMGGVALITADHGNCEEMYERDKKGAFVRSDSGLYKPRTSHTTHPVPLSLYDPHDQIPARLGRTTDRPGLANLAATTLELLGFAPPDDYRPSLLVPTK